MTLSGPSSEIEKVATCTAEVTHKRELTDSVTLDTALRFYTSAAVRSSLSTRRWKKSSVDVTLQVYKMATLPVTVNFINAPRGV